jgi:hypothetical protein
MGINLDEFAKSKKPQKTILPQRHREYRELFL